ncbi:MAG: hypothetical protein IRZ02_01765 [Acidothermus sp.]|nr:hypothetical protein [Acidothermus sp.]MCL6537740.1 hypothetical protein [Acidothermus sp.]
MSDEPVTSHDDVGDPACWANRVCLRCGAFDEENRGSRCAVCGYVLSIDADEA